MFITEVCAYKYSPSWGLQCVHTWNQWICKSSAFHNQFERTNLKSGQGQLITHDFFVTPDVNITIMASIKKTPVPLTVLPWLAEYNDLYVNVGSMKAYLSCKKKNLELFNLSLIYEKRTFSSYLSSLLWWDCPSSYLHILSSNCPSNAVEHVCSFPLSMIGLRVKNEQAYCWFCSGQYDSSETLKITIS